MDPALVVSLFPKRANNCKHSSRRMCCPVKQWQHCGYSSLPSIIDEGVVFHTRLTDCMSVNYRCVCV